LTTRRVWPLVALLLLSAVVSAAADRLPSRLSDDAFWKLIGTLSEDSGTFQSENLLSNETDFPKVMAALKRTAKPGGVYLGVGPEQNFNYIAAIRPKIALIIDIRRQNMLEHLMYKAIFELSPDRASFVARLFSRKPVAQFPNDGTAAELFDAYSEVPADAGEFERNLKSMQDLLIRTRGFTLPREDRESLANVYAAFRDFGPLIDYNSRGGGPSGRASWPSYQELMTQPDEDGREWSYLASEDNYRVVRDLELRNLIVPLTGDFGGTKAIRAVGEYLKDKGATVSAFYVSNVEGYLFRGGDRRGNPNGGAAMFYDNVARLPLDVSSTFIRWIPNAGRTDGSSSVVLAPMQKTVEDFDAGRLTGADLSAFRFNNGNRRGRFDGNPYSAPAQRWWIGAIRTAFHLVLALNAFLVRFFLFSPPKERDRFASPRRVLFSLAWAAGVYALAAGVYAFFRL
jgi:hypothetical protein